MIKNISFVYASSDEKFNIFINSHDFDTVIDYKEIIEKELLNQGEILDNVINSIIFKRIKKSINSNKIKTILFRVKSNETVLIFRITELFKREFYGNKKHLNFEIVKLDD